MQPVKHPETLSRKLLSAVRSPFTRSRASRVSPLEGRVSSRLSGRLLIAAAVGSALLVGPAYALRVPQQQGLQDRVLAPAGFVATVVPQDVSDVQAELDAPTLADVAKFREEHGPDWRLYDDRRSGGMALVEGSGIPWIPGRGNRLDPQDAAGSGANGAYTLDDLAGKALAFIESHPNLFRVP